MGCIKANIFFTNPSGLFVSSLKGSEVVVEKNMRIRIRRDYMLERI